MILSRGYETVFMRFFRPTVLLARTAFHDLGADDCLVQGVEKFRG
jgi:hypothetical protein